ncbi:hypothetical protein [Teichococcus oryzae]|uniref:Uncharacterized protein n=1 Tax=Teichococcus oryzae TaxID=1608942 RepID=A0A5B2TFD9_9PROT|nr:hypothetical protein [Pseudoroseomonas oryzae]KAA2213191.1 hypothetical protein F0Q34_11190 [Pseudoroseomonas oryzae]
MTDRSRERRWLILSEDGRHVWLGRYSDPSEEEIASAEASLAAQSLGGYVAVAEGDYWSRKARMTLLPVRPLGGPRIPFEQASDAFEAIRARRLSELA